MARRTGNPTKLVLNYKFRLCPSAEQERILGRTMKFAWANWARMVRFARQARGRRKKGRTAEVRKELAGMLLGKEMTGRRVEKVARLVREQGLTHEVALSRLTSDQVRRAWQIKRSGLDVEYAVERTDRARPPRLWGGLFYRLVEKYRLAWQACWDGTRKPPRKGTPGDATWLCAQILGGRNPVKHTVPVNALGDNWVDLGVFFPPRMRSDQDLTAVRFIHHRPFPLGSKLKDVKVTRASVRPGSAWHVVFAVEMPLSSGEKPYPATGFACGIDPGRKVPVTLAGEDVSNPGQDGEEHGPGRPFTKASKKLRRLQRKLDRQTRANNPECFREDGTWIKGQKISRYSNNMLQTKAEIEKLSAHVASIRKDCYSRLADEILSRYDTVYIGNWRDGSPEAKRLAKRERKGAFAESGTKRPKGEAARQRAANRMDRDNALGVFRQIINEKAKRSTTRKQVIVVTEFNTTRQCVHCAALTGPAGVKGLKIRESWSCLECGKSQIRDRGAAWNILQVGRQAAAQAVTGGETSVARTPKGKGAKSASRSGRGKRERPNPRPKSDRVSVVHARGIPIANSRPALASADRLHVQAVAVEPPGSAGSEMSRAAEPLAKDDGTQAKPPS